MRCPRNNSGWNPSAENRAPTGGFPSVVGTYQEQKRRGCGVSKSSSSSAADTRGLRTHPAHVQLPHTRLTASLQELCGLALPTSGLHDLLTPILYMLMLVFFNLNRRVRKGFQKQVNSFRSSDEPSYWVVDTPGPAGVQLQHQE